MLTSVLIPWSKHLEIVRAFKQCHRKEDDIALVNACLRLRCAQSEAGEWLVEEAAVAYGGVAPKVLVATNLQAALAGQRLDDKLVQVRVQ